MNYDGLGKEFEDNEFKLFARDWSSGKLSRPRTLEVARY